MSEVLELIKDVRGKNDTATDLVLGDVVAFGILSSDEPGLSLKLPALTASAHVAMGFGVVQAPAGTAVAVGEYCLVRVRGPSKIRVNASGADTVDGECLRVQTGVHLALAATDASMEMDPAGTETAAGNTLMKLVIGVANEVTTGTPADTTIDGFVTCGRW